MTTGNAVVSGSFALAALCSVLILFSEFRAEFVPGIVVNSRLLPHELAAAAQAAESAASGMWARTNARVVAAQYYELLAAREDQTDRRIQFLCKQLSLLGGAIERRPQNARLLVSWANVRQVLGSIDCASPQTRGDFRDAIELALTRNQVSPQVLYSGALLYLWGNERERALDLFQKVLLLGINVPQFQRETIYRQLSRPDDVKSVVPQQFPQIIEASRWIAQNEPELFELSRGVLAAAQLTALRDDMSRFQRGQQPFELHVQRLMALLDVAASQEVRQRADGALARHYRALGDNESAAFFTERAQFEELPIVRSELVSDTRPLKSSLVVWGEDKSTVLDDFYHTIGFFVSGGARPKIIQLEGARDSSPVDSSMLRIFVSNDNLRWTEVQSEARITSLSVNGVPLFAIHLSTGFFKYWKVHFASSARSRRFSNSLDSLIKVFG